MDLSAPHYRKCPLYANTSDSGQSCLSDDVFAYLVEKKIACNAPQMSDLEKAKCLAASPDTHAKIREEAQHDVQRLTTKIPGPSDSLQLLSNSNIDNVMRNAQKLRFPKFYHHGFVMVDFDTAFDADIVGDGRKFGKINLATDVWPKYNTFGVVMNTDRYENSGKHWICIFVDMREYPKNVTIEFFNSSGREAQNAYAQWMQRQAANFRASGAQAEVIHVSHRAHQLLKTECGVYCLYYILNRLGIDNNKVYPWTFFRDHHIDDHMMHKFRAYLFNNNYTESPQGVHVSAGVEKLAPNPNWPSSAAAKSGGRDKRIIHIFAHMHFASNETLMKLRYEPNVAVINLEQLNEDCIVKTLQSIDNIANFATQYKRGNEFMIKKALSDNDIAHTIIFIGQEYTGMEQVATGERYIVETSFPEYQAYILDDHNKFVDKLLNWGSDPESCSLELLEFAAKLHNSRQYYTTDAQYKESFALTARTLRANEYKDLNFANFVKELRGTPVTPPKFIIAHIVGQSSAGKTTLGKQLREKFPSIKVVDLDEIQDATAIPYLEKHQIQTMSQMHAYFNVLADVNQRAIAKIFAEQKTHIIFTGYTLPGMTKVETHATHRFYLDDGDGWKVFRRYNARALSAITNNAAQIAKLMNDEKMSPVNLWLLINAKFGMRGGFLCESPFETERIIIKNSRADPLYQPLSTEKIIAQLSAHIKKIGGDDDYVKKSMPRPLVLHISGAPGVGKTTFGKWICENLQNVKVIDIDDLYDYFVTKLTKKTFKADTFATKFQQVFDEFFDKQSAGYRAVVVIGLNYPDPRITIEGKEYHVQPFSIKIPADRKLFLDDADDKIMQRYIARTLERTAKDINNVIARDSFVIDVREIRKNLTYWRKVYARGKYEFVEMQDIQRVVASIIN
jgi:adenylate kinase family enzyme